MQTFYLPRDEFLALIRGKERGISANLKVIEGRFRWAVKLEAQEAIVRPIEKLSRWQHFKKVIYGDKS